MKLKASVIITAHPSVRLTWASTTGAACTPRASMTRSASRSDVSGARQTTARAGVIACWTCVHVAALPARGGGMPRARR